MRNQQKEFFLLGYSKKTFPNLHYFGAKNFYSATSNFSRKKNKHLEGYRPTFCNYISWLNFVLLLKTNTKNGVKKDKGLYYSAIPYN